MNQEPLNPKTDYENNPYLHGVVNGRLDILTHNNIDVTGDSESLFINPATSVLHIDRDAMFGVEVEILDKSYFGGEHLSIVVAYLRQESVVIGFGVKNLRFKEEEALPSLTPQDIETNLVLELYRHIKNAPAETIFDFNAVFGILLQQYFEEIPDE